MFKDDMVERYPDDTPREWINPTVINIKPNGDVRFCLDMRETNAAIRRPLTPIPTLAEAEAKFRGAERFTKLDLKEAYNQFELTEKSRIET